MAELDGKSSIEIVKEPMHSTIEWYDTENCPENNRPILAYTANKKFMTINNVRDNWKWYTDKYAIVAWTYQDEIIIS